ncbi:MAG: methyltransferase domain-containing protein [Anaeromyxobacter sp.]
MADSRYIHGTTPEEQARLALLNDLLNGACLRELAVRPGERILDVGCGLGHLGRAMARAAGRPALGIERSPEQLERARALGAPEPGGGALELRQGDALDLPLGPEEWGAFDLAHARFVLEHVPAPEVVVAGMVRAVRPGGRVVLCDDDHSLLRLHPEPPGVRAVWDAFVRTYDRLGNDPYVGRRLATLLVGAGARPRRSTWIFFGACHGDPAFPGFARNLAGNLAGAREAIAATGMVTGAEVDAAAAALVGFGDRPGASIGYAAPWVEGVRPGHAEGAP